MSTIKQAIEEHDVVALREPIGTWPAGTTGTVVSLYVDAALIEVGEDDPPGSALADKVDRPPVWLLTHQRPVGVVIPQRRRDEEPPRGLEERPHLIVAFREGARTVSSTLESQTTLSVVSR
jgi:hypothetical protein